MSEALATLPWVESSQIVPDPATKHVVFGVKDKGQFNFDEVKVALRKQNSKYERGLELVQGPK